MRLELIAEPWVTRGTTLLLFKEGKFITIPTVPLYRRGTATRGALRCFQRALAALVACENEFSLTRWHKPCDDWNVRANESRG